ncbi:MAG: hypothetical protein V4739_07025 [Pseudomonadota bacterium]
MDAISTKVSLSAVTVAMVLAMSGCASPRMESRVVEDNKAAMATASKAVNGQGVGAKAGGAVAGGAQDADRRAAEQSAQVVLRRASKPWVASVSVPMGSGEKLPSVFQEPVRLAFKDNRSAGKVGLRQVADRITAATGVPVRVKADALTSSSGPGSPAPAIMAAPGQMGGLPPLPGFTAGPASVPQGMAGSPVMGMNPAPSEPAMDAVAMRWEGSLEGYLNHITDLTNLSWEYRDGVIVIERFKTEFFEIASLEGETSYAMGLNASDQGTTGAGHSGGGGGAASSSNNASADVSEKGKASAVATILAAIQQITRDVPGSSTVRSDGSGRMAVTTTKETMVKVRDFVRAENDAMLRQAQIQFDIYSVRTSESNERGVDWSLVLRSLSDALALKVNSPATLTGSGAGNMGFSVLTPDQTNASRAVRFADSNAVLAFLSQQGTATQHRPVSLLTLNRQWARKASLGSQAYVSETTAGASSALGGAGGLPGIKTSTVTTGDRYLAQPYIMDNNTVVLKFGIGLSSLVNLPSFVSAGQTIQTPEVTNIIDQSTIALKSGQILVITGLSRIITSDDKATLTEDSPLAAGGSKRLSRQREDFIIFVRPTIL